MRDNDIVKQIIPADGWWIKYKDDENGSFFYRKIITFALMETKFTQHAYDFLSWIEPIDSCDSRDSISDHRSDNYIEAIYAPELYKLLCSQCTHLQYECVCLKKT